MGSFIGESVSIGTQAIDIISLDNTSKKYSELEEQIRVLQEQLDVLRSKDISGVVIPSIAKIAVANFVKVVRTFAKNRDNADIDLNLIDGASVLYTYLAINYSKKFHSAYVETEDLLVNSKKTKWAERYKGLKLLDNRLVYLINNARSDENPLRSFLGNLVLEHYMGKGTIPSDLRLDFDKYISVTLFNEFAMTSEGVFVLPSDTMSLDSLINNINFSANTGGGCTKLESGIVCDAISFKFNNKDIVITTGDAVQNSERKTTLRKPLLKVLQWVVLNTDLVLSSILVDSDNIKIVKGKVNKDLALTLSKTELYSCSIICQVVNNDEEYILPHPALPAQSCKLLATIFDSLGLDLKDVKLHFKR